MITVQMALDQYAKEKQELEARVEALKAELAAKTAECEHLKTVANGFQKDAEYWENEYCSLNRDYDRLLRQ